MANDGGSSDKRRDRFVPAIPVNAIYQINPPRTWTAIGSGVARVINTASASHRGATLDLDDLQSAKSFGPIRAYGRSKLCNILIIVSTGWPQSCGNAARFWLNQEWLAIDACERLT
jgi:hypothetical protein